MKKIVAILVGVVMTLSACVDNGESDSKPIVFPELQLQVAESGNSYEITFSAEKAWMVSLPNESQIYATLTYEGVTEVQHFGAAGEDITIVVNVREGLLSYAKDFVFNVEITMEEKTQDLAVFTIPRAIYEIDVKGSVPPGKEAFVVSTFEKGGHPENGPFASTANTYTVRYLNRADATYGDFDVSHDCELLYNYVVYAKSSADGEFEKVEGNSNTWLNLRTWKPKGDSRSYFALDMMHASTSAVKTKNVGYEAYVNLEDENGDALVSVYFLYDPTAVVEVKTSFALADPTLAAEKGVKLEGSDMTYTLTLPSANLIGEDYAAATLKLEGYSDIFGGMESGSTDLDFNSDTATGLCYLTLKEGASAESLRRNDVLKITGTAISGGTHEYTVNLVFDWIEATAEEEYPETEE